MNKFFHDFRGRNRHASVLWLAHQIEDNWEALLKSGWPDGWQDYWDDETASETATTRFVSSLLRQSSIGILQNTFFEANVDDQTLISQSVDHAEYCIQYALLKSDTPPGRAVKRSLRDGPKVATEQTVGPEQRIGRKLKSTVLGGGPVTAVVVWNCGDDPCIDYSLWHFC